MVQAPSWKILPGTNGLAYSPSLTVMEEKNITLTIGIWEEASPVKIVPESLERYRGFCLG
jgi:hypothetical protein